MEGHNRLGTSQDSACVRTIICPVRVNLPHVRDISIILDEQWHLAVSYHPAPIVITKNPHRRSETADDNTAS